VKLTPYHIHPLLKGHIEKLWVFESNGRMPPSDLRVIVPNGLLKIVIPIKNGLKATLNGEDRVSKTNVITLIGISDIPSVVVDVEDSASATIGIEFSPLGAYRFFNLTLEEIKNSVLPLSDLMGKVGRDLQERIANENSVNEKVSIVQRFLLQQFQSKSGDEIFEYCVRKILETHGQIQVSQLEKLTGYSSRWLNMKFYSRLGISPKNLCSLIRFQHIYHNWARNNFKSFDKIDVYSFYHDQAHFIKDFKRFTGYSPNKYQLQDNEFGRIFYKG
jgi:AraC-like DNA-binding protein